MLGANSDVASIGMWDRIVHFAVESNMSVEAAASPSFRSVIRDAFAAGFQRAIQKPKSNVDHEFNEFCPQRRPTALRKAFIEIAAGDRLKLERPLKDNKFAAMTMDAGQVSSTKLFITNLVAGHLNCCFTSGIQEILTSQDHASLVEFLAAELRALATDKEIHVSVILCDGATYQTKALNWEDRSSLQATHPTDPLLSRVLYVPCLCHRLNNAYRRLVRDSTPYRNFIVELRQLGKFCRKPVQRRLLHGICPEFIETRWLYDCRILQFVLSREAEINGLGDAQHQVTQAFHDFAPLLEHWHKLVTVLEASNRRLASAYPIILEATGLLEKLRGSIVDSTRAEVYTFSIGLIKQYTIDSCSDILQLAYVLTPQGREHAREQLHALRGSRGLSTRAFELELVDFDAQLADHDREVPEDADNEHEDISEDPAGEIVESLYEPASAPFFMTVPDARSPSTHIAARAHTGLDRILAQFHFGQGEARDVHRMLDNYLDLSEAEIEISQTFDERRYLWLSAPTRRPEYADLAEIALRLEPAICSESPSERAIGQQRRYLVPHRTRTKPDLLLARTEMDDFRNSGRTMSPAPP
jgi:hypothetical protein